MALNVAVLKAGIERILVAAGKGAGPATPLEAAAAWAGAYDDYARAAMDVSGDALVTANRPGFQSALRFPAKSGTSASAAAEFQSAFIAYWTGAVFAVGIPPATPTVPCPSVPPAPPWAVEVSSVVLSVAPGLAGLLTPIFSNTSNRPPSAVAAELASAFHSATTTNVLVLITGITTPPPPGGLPVTNTCTIF